MPFRVLRPTTHAKCSLYILNLYWMYHYRLVLPNIAAKVRAETSGQGQGQGPEFGGRNWVENVVSECEVSYQLKSGW